MQAGVVVREKHHTRIIREFTRGEIGEKLRRASLAREQFIQRGKRLPVEARVDQHCALRSGAADDLEVAQQFPEAVFPVSTIVGVILFELPRRLRKLAREIIRDAQPPVRRILRRIERDHFLKVSHRSRELSEKQPAITAPRIEGDLLR